MLRIRQQLASILQYVECNLLLFVTSASDLPRRTTKFCFVLFSSLWSSMSMMVMIDKIHWCTAVCAVHCTIHRRSCCSYRSSHRSDNQIFVMNRDFCLPHLHSMPLLGGLRRNIAMTFGMEIREWWGYPMVNNFWRYV